MSGDLRIVAGLARSLLSPVPTNFVERPWGGTAIRAFKGLCPLPDQREATGAGIGEAFEIAACDDDPETRAHPSSLRLEDGSILSLPALLQMHAETLLGPRFVARYGTSFPLLPKVLCIKELLSVQGHPPGNTEAYVIIDAEPGATIRLGFNRDVDAGEFATELRGGLELQQLLLDTLVPHVDQHAMQQTLGAWFAERRTDEREALAMLDRWLIDDRRGAAAAALSALKRCYWSVLDRLNEIPVEAGRTIYNANPPRIVEAAGIEPSAEVHALGNPDGREILALEIRRPGPTFRAWDNVRFPRRNIDLDAAIGALNLRKTDAREFVVERVPVDGRQDVSRSVVSRHFSVEHLTPAAGGTVTVPDEPPHSLHVIKGRVAVTSDQGGALGVLARGGSAIVPVGVGAYHVEATADEVDVVKIALPMDA